MASRTPAPAPEPEQPDEPTYLDTTTWYGAVRHLADPATGHAAPDTGREEFVSLCHQAVMAQEAFTHVRRANSHPSVLISDLPLCTACTDMKARPAKSPEEILEEFQP
ncbi:hypothetical protein [Nocardia phage NBR1]|uniref:hypothetical protein n=1 Tax=Nocardia phage NBR1 TaxID=1109711 RepID=UPI00023EEE00|nr:hypothetical protein NoPhNBR1_gp61 [Nocardia phage NBR1]AEV52274.1 hypothetical protein [Nocardia phage NBR1]